MVGSRSRMADVSTVMSVVFMTTAAWAWRAKVGATGRASSDIARSIGSGTCRRRPGLPPAAMSRSASWVKLRFSGPATSRSRPCSDGSRTVRSTTPATSWAETKLMGLRPGPKTRAWPLSGSLAPVIAIQVSR
jgi:hypothetical protein